MSIGKQIKIERIKNDISCETLSERAKLSRGYLSDIERERTQASLNAILKLENAFKTLGSNIDLVSQFLEEKKKAIL